MNKTFITGDLYVIEPTLDKDSRTLLFL